MTQDSTNSQAKLNAEIDKLGAILERTKPTRPIDLLQLEITGEGNVHAIKRDRLTHALTVAMIDELAAQGWYRREGYFVKSDMTEGRIDVPYSVQIAAVCSLKFSLKEEVEWTDEAGKKKKRTMWTPCEEPPKNVERLLDQVDTALVLQKIMASPNLKEVVFANEPERNLNCQVLPTEPPPPKTDQEISDKSRAEIAFAAWLAWMQKYAPTELNYFDLIGHAHCFAATSQGFYAKHIHVAVGPNGGGKGTMIRLLDSILGFAPVKIFSMDDASAEYRADQIFDSLSSLIGCHEWRFEKNSKIDPFIGAMKSATRGEAVNVRGVGKATQSVKSKCSFFLFYNSPAGANQEAALTDSYRQMAVWDAYDRVNVAYVDWAHRLKLLEPNIFNELMWALQFAPNWVGVCVRQYISGLDAAALAPKLNFIPQRYKNERATTLYEPFQIALIQAAELAAHTIIVLSTPSIPMSVEDREEHAIEATQNIGKILGMDVPAEGNWFASYAADDWFFWLPAGRMSSAMIAKRGGREWAGRMPVELDGVYLSSKDGRTLRLNADDKLTKIHHLIRGTKEARLFLERLIAPTLTAT